MLLPVACVLFSCAGEEGLQAIGGAALHAVQEPGREAVCRVAGELPVMLASGRGVAGDAELSSGTMEGWLNRSKAMMILMPYDTVKAHNPYETHFDSMPPGGIKIKINPLGGTLGRVFNDSNKFHIAVAETNGIEPLHTLKQLWREAPRLERLQTCEAYYLDNLTHSLPYLVPKAHRLLTDIGMAFRDSLEARGGGYYRVKVTSVLRTPAMVRRLRRRNRNAVDTSAHLYATTFDISYLKFICDTPSIPRTQEDLKNLLGEVVEDMRRQQRCYVKYERKQACYHITAR